MSLLMFTVLSLPYVVLKAWNDHCAKVGFVADKKMKASLVRVWNSLDSTTILAMFTYVYFQEETSH